MRDGNRNKIDPLGLGEGNKLRKLLNKKDCLFRQSFL
jgi:hypothetical protein